MTATQTLEAPEVGECADYLIQAARLIGGPSI